VTITFNAADALSGVASVTPPVLVQTEGANQVFTGAAADVAGNAASLPVSVSVIKRRPRRSINSIRLRTMLSSLAATRSPESCLGPSLRPA